ncbi:44328_t:CDS:1 [Gigaspora margarita]|uniref:44328_t:CDS:1 n=1 Tax=Gigaspora margarita TaxID=4874 RepID=A0ABN7U7M9_GIGMA|nr:44328_t:CDS:1 [Gigaspora margarita]
MNNCVRISCPANVILNNAHEQKFRFDVEVFTLIKREENMKTLDYKIKFIRCSTDEMIFNERFKFGYYIKSLDVKVSPTPNVDNQFTPITPSSPQGLNRNVTNAEDVNARVTIAATPSATVGYNNVNTTTGREWEIIISGANYDRWEHRYKAKKNYRNAYDSRRNLNLADYEYGSQWQIDNTTGFYIEITQVLRLKQNRPDRIMINQNRISPDALDRLSRQKPKKIIHTLKVTFDEINSEKNFDNEFKGFLESYNSRGHHTLIVPNRNNDPAEDHFSSNGITIERRLG